MSTNQEPNPQTTLSQAILRERLLAAIDMMEFGLELMRQNIKRNHPDASEQERSTMLERWQFEAPAGICFIDSSVPNKSL